MSVIKGYVKSGKLNAKAQKFDVNELGEMSYTDIPKGSIIEGYIWGGSGYTKGSVLFVVKSGGYIEPASSKEWKTMEACWHTDKGVIEAFVDYANDTTGDVASIVGFLTDTESHSMVAESELGEYGYTPDDDGHITLIGYNKKGENVYLVRN